MSDSFHLAIVNILRRFHSVRVSLESLFVKKSTAVLSSEDIERRFWDAEDDRTEIYERTRRQQQLDFALAAKPWTKEEENRNGTFQRFLLSALEAFSIHQERRVVEFKEVMDRHDKIFRSGNKTREAAFDDATAKRASMFQETQERRMKAIEDNLVHQERLYEQGRERREVEVQGLIVWLRELFEQTVREEEAVFADAQRERVQRVMAILVSEDVAFRPPLTY